MNPTRDVESARSADEVVAAIAAALRFWSRDELSRLVTGETLPQVECVADIEAWADRLDEQARHGPLMEPDEAARERLVRLFLLASVKLRLLERVAHASHLPFVSRYQAARGALV
jgi:hypothetical protein